MTLPTMMFCVNSSAERKDHDEISFCCFGDAGGERLKQLQQQEGRLGLSGRR